MLRVKICGVTNRADAEEALQCGADALGFNLWPGSRRHIPLSTVTAIATDLPKSAERVAVMVDPTFAEVLKVTASGCIDSIQLHGHESTDFCRQLRNSGVAFTKAIAIGTPVFDKLLGDFSTNSMILDTSSDQGFGGSGKTFPWDWARSFVQSHLELRVWLAGGLTPENVAEAIHVARPHGVDVTTGVERSPGRKDRIRMAAFVKAARAA